MTTTKTSGPGAAQDSSATSEAIATWPEHVYLQRGEEDERFAGITGEDYTWCDHKIELFDVEYVRADLARTATPSALPSDLQTRIIKRLVADGHSVALPSVAVGSELHDAACDLLSKLKSDPDFKMTCMDGTTNVVGIVKAAWSHAPTAPVSTISAGQGELTQQELAGLIAQTADINGFDTTTPGGVDALVVAVAREVESRTRAALSQPTEAKGAPDCSALNRLPDAILSKYSEEANQPLGEWQMKMAGAQAVPDCGACPGDGSICKDNCRLASESPEGAEVAGEGDFAKIVRASNGQQVLFFKEVDADEGNILHCVVSFPDAHMDMKLGGLPDDAFADSLKKADVAMADKVIGQAAEFGLGGDA